MSMKYAGILLLALALGIWVFWERKPESISATPQLFPSSTESGPDLTPLLVSLEQRLASFEARLLVLEQRESTDIDVPAETAGMLSRLEALESQLRRQPDSQQSTGAGEASVLEGGFYGSESEDSHLVELRQAFNDDDNAEPAMQVALENAESLFDNQALDQLEFRQIDCRAHYCRLTYENLSSGGAAVDIAENELILLLAEKYGDSIIVHGGERDGSSKTLYIELGVD